MITQFLRLLTKMYPNIPLETLIVLKEYDYVTFCKHVGVPPDRDDSYVLVPIDVTRPLSIFNCKWFKARMTPIEKIDYNRQLPTINQVETFKQRIK